ncbi:MAG: acyltransferase [Bacteroidaceae bacterium]|nr:acyltransferase [Bacteroidaceae bacterium]
MKMLKVLDEISGQRNVQLGIAIFLVIVYHLYCLGMSDFPFNLFKWGYIGVDIFLFYSGWGLTRSYSNKSIGKFYISRFVRIYPMYLIVVLYTAFRYIVQGKTFSVWDFICNATGLSYWELGGSHFEWYLMAILNLYIFFPLFVKLFNILGGVCLLTNVIVLFLVYNVSFVPDHLFLISRIPIFMLGIYVCKFMGDKNFDRNLGFILFLYLLGAFLCMCLKGQFRYLMTTYLAPFLIFAISKIRLDRIGMCKPLNFIGTKTLELYCAQIPTMTIVIALELKGITLLTTYVVLQCIFSILFVALNKYVQMIIAKLIK